MKKFKHLVFVSMATLVIATISSVTIKAQQVNVCGTWNLSVQTSAGGGNPVFVFKQVNDSIISGNYNGAFGEAPVNGKIKDNRIIFKFTVSDFLIEYTGIVDGNNMKGTLKLGDMGEGTFTGKKQED